MTMTTDTELARSLRRAAIRATRAPSVHNTQPWRFVVRDGGLDVVADWSRRLTVLDPRGRQLLMSCGCAVFNARVALAAGAARGHGRAVRPTTPVPISSRGSSPSPSWEPRPGAGPAGAGDRHAGRPTAAGSPTSRCRRSFIESPTRGGPRRRLRAVPHHPRGAPARVGEPEPARRQDRERRSRLPRRDAAVDQRRSAPVWTACRPLPSRGSPATRTTTSRCATSTPAGMGWLPDETRSSVAAVSGAARHERRQSRRVGAVRRGARAGAARDRPPRVHLQPADPGDRSPAHARRCCATMLALQMHPHILIRIGRAPLTTPTRRRRLVDVLAVDE